MMVGVILVDLVIFVAMTIWLLKKIRAAKSGTKTSSFLLLLVLAVLTTPALAVDTVVGEPISYTTTVHLSGNGDGEDNVQTVFDWGDGTQTTTGFVPIGTRVNRSHVWEKPGVYEVRAKAVGVTTESVWYTLGHANVLESNPIIFVWLVDANGTQITGTVDLWSEQVHVEKTVSPGDPLEYKLEPGNYTIIGRSEGYQNTETSFEVPPEPRRPLNLMLKMQKTPSEAPNIPGFGTSVVIAALAIAIAIVRMNKGSL
ncbi:MAG: hypothetical protein KAJ91_00210 [Candidatus Aenigmarchaeota archaeon]|nr:hypothetical protein [Candidatus Aenigmarchaeota archaeon]